MKTYNLIAVVLLFIIGSVSGLMGQGSPGYMGKKIGIGYRIHLMPGFGNQPSANQSYTTDEFGSGVAKKFKINSYHQGFLEFVIAKNKTLIFEGIFSKSQFRPGTFDGNEYKGASGWGQMKSYGGSLGLRWYKKHLAPLSSFLGVNTGWQIVSAESLSYINYNDENILVPGGERGSLVLGIEFGTNRIIADAVILTFSFESNLVLGIMARSYLGIESDDSPLLDDAVWRMQTEQIASIGIGIGFMP